MKSFTVSKNDAGQRLDKFISKTVPLLPKSLLYKYIRTKRIKINQKKGDISMMLCEGDVVDMYINDEFFDVKKDNYDFFKASTKLDIIYEDENLLILDKCVGLLAHPDKAEFNDTLVCRVKRYLYEKGEYNPKNENSFTPALVNRIDRNTGGIVIAAKNAETLRILNQKLKDRELKKEYLCVVYGCIKEKFGILEAYMTKDEKKNKVTVFDRQVPGSKIMKTKYNVLSEKDGFSLVEVELLTGRAHQIRAHFAHIGHPLLGDEKYGENSKNSNKRQSKQYLYSYKLTFDFKTDAGALNYLKGKTFSVKDVWFKQEFLEDNFSKGTT